MFKNAGTTFDWSLKRCFGTGFIDHRDDEDMIKGAGKYLENFIRKNKEVKALSSHHIQFPLPNLSDINIQTAFLIRHPIDRAGSVYRFERQQKANTPGAVIAKKLSFQNYVLWRMIPKNGPVIRDYQSRILLGRSIVRPNQEINEDQFKLILEAISNNQLVGLVEMYDESMVLFEEILRTKYPQINLSYIKQNISQDKSSNLSNSINDVMNQLDSETKKILLNENKWDFLLHRAAMEVILNRITNVSYFNQKLIDFRRRCEELENIVITSPLQTNTNT